jgi:hypothetical protein
MGQFEVCGDLRQRARDDAGIVTVQPASDRSDRSDDLHIRARLHAGSRCLARSHHSQPCLDIRAIMGCRKVIFSFISKFRQIKRMLGARVSLLPGHVFRMIF